MEPRFGSLLSLAVLMVALSPSAGAQKKPPPPRTARLYILDCGILKGIGVDNFNFKEGEVPARDLVVPCYLVVHPKGTLMWDTGTLPDSVFAGKGPVTQGISTVQRPLLPQLAALGYTPRDMTYLAFSHFHSDHTANANAFAASTWLVSQPERDAMFADPPPRGMAPAAYFNALKNSKTTILKTDEYDVFGDGKVVIKQAPGHTPGHQVLFLRLAQTGPVLVAGDLYHYPEERTLNRFPTFEFDVPASARSRAAIDEFLKRTGAALWIEHDLATYMKLKKAPDFYE